MRARPAAPGPLRTCAFADGRRRLVCWNPDADLGISRCRSPCWNSATMSRNHVIRMRDELDMTRIQLLADQQNLREILAGLSRTENVLKRAADAVKESRSILDRIVVPEQKHGTSDMTPT